MQNEDCLQQLLLPFTSAETGNKVLAIEAVVFLVSAFDYSDIKPGKKSGYRWTIRKEKDETAS